MMTFLQDYWPLLLVIAAALLGFWAIDHLAENRGINKGRAQMHREIFGKRNGGRP